MGNARNDKPTVDALYEQVRAVAPVTAGEVATSLIQVAPRIRVLALRTPTLPPAAHTNAYLVGPEQGPQFAVDPGSPYPDQQQVLNEVVAAEASAGRPLAGIWLTHHHGDHVGGAAALAARWQVPIAAHVLTARRLDGVIAVDTLVADGDVIGGATALHTPGHADGHLCFEIDQSIIAGDMVAGLGTILIDPSEGDMALYIASLGRLLARPQATLYPAHGPTIPDGHRKLREYIAHRTMREDRVVAALSAHVDASLGELVPEVYADTPRMLWPLAERSLLAHLDKLVREGKAREVTLGRWSAR
ncbi:MAG: beta-lactamase domain protein [Myxococcales bacterium]|nr:beta-lactamase domain protein [Myxococcales bacterium]